MKSEKISELTTNRLSVYLRCLNTLAAAGIKSISSQSLAEQFNLNSAQIRKDLGYFGEFGVRGVGYSVADLREHITKNADYVGQKFPEEARKIHYDEVPARGIHGEATAEEAKALKEEGIEFFPLPILPEDRN